MLTITTKLVPTVSYYISPLKTINIVCLQSLSFILFVNAAVNKIAIVVFASSVVTLVSLDVVSYPTHKIGKSCKVSRFHSRRALQKSVAQTSIETKMPYATINSSDGLDVRLRTMKWLLCNR